MLAVTVLLDVALNTAFGWWYADPLAGLTLVHYAIREAVSIFKPGPYSRTQNPAIPASDRSHD